MDEVATLNTTSLPINSITSTTNSSTSEASWNHHNVTESDLDLMGSKQANQLEEEVAGEHWDSFLQAYALGKWSNEPIVPLVASERHQDDLENSDRDFGKLGVELSTSVDEIREVFTTKGYLPAPIGPNETERRMVCMRFGLDSLGRREALDKIAQLTKVHFKVPLCVISIVLEDKEIFVSSAGWSDEEDDVNYQQPVIPLVSGVCPHSMLLTSKGDPAFIMEDASIDWRFRGNPYVKNGGGVCFFASTNIFLPTAFSRSSHNESTPGLLPIGSLCLIDSNARPRDSFTDQDELFLKHLADLIAREIQYGFDQSRQATASKQTAFLGDFLRTSLVLPNQDDFEPPTSSKVLADSSINHVKQTSLPFDSAAEATRSLTQADSSVIIDLRSFNAPHAPSSLPINSPTITPQSSTVFTRAPTIENIQHSREGSVRSSSVDLNGSGITLQTNEAQRRGGMFSGLAPGAGSVSVFGSSGSDWSKAIESKDSKTCISDFLDKFYSEGLCRYDNSNSNFLSSPLIPILPTSTTAFLACPIFDFDGKPALLLIVSSTTKYFRFEASDRQFVENVGAVAIGSLLRRRILEADRAKLAFVSQVSHEILTPVHGIVSQLELIRMVTAPPYLDTIKPLLAVADVCVTSLREILDDTLTFAKMSNPTDSLAPIRKLHKVVLEDLVEDVIKSCWARTNQHAAIVGDENGVVGVGSNGSGANLKIIMEIEKKLRGCKALVDVGGLKRVLFNLVGNALKFTQVGSITLALKVLSSPSGEIGSSNSHSVVFEVIDTGVGMSEEFLRDQLFIPFRQLDSFSEGAGLGASICDNIVKRMDGTLHFSSTLGSGTTATAIVPLELFFESEGITYCDSTSGFDWQSESTCTRIISDELRLLLDSESKLLLDPLQTGTSKLVEGDEKQLVETEAEIVMLSETIDAVTIEGKSKEECGVLVLVVDDNIIARKILTTFLSVKGVRFIEAENGLDAVEAFELFRPSLVWIDVQMPIMDGLEASRRMRVYEQEHDLLPSRIVALSGLSSDGAVHSSAISSGQISQWLTKGGRSLKILGEDLARLQVAAVENRAASDRTKVDSSCGSFRAEG